MDDPFVVPEPPQVDPDKHCAVPLRGGGGRRCAVGLSCKIHSDAQKRSVLRSCGLDELIARQARPMGLKKIDRRKKFPTIVVDLDVHCGVALSDGELCKMNLLCRDHDLAQKNAVPGRTVELDDVQLRQTGLIYTDTMCSVPLPDGRKCPRNLGCTEHSTPEKRAVARSASLEDLRALQKNSPKSKSKGDTEKGRVRGLINTAMNKEFAIVYPDKDDAERLVELGEAYRHLKKLQISEQTDSYAWEDAYFSTPITVASRGESCSFEALMPLVWVKGIPREHVFSNTVLTTEYANKLCDTYPSIALRIFHQLDAATLPAERAELVLRLDHLHLIRCQIPWSCSKRLALRCEPSFAEEFATQCHTGVATLSGCRHLAHNIPGMDSHPWKITTALARVVADSVTDDECAELDDVRQFVADLENISQTQFPRVNGVPYPFQGGPHPANWSWNFFYLFAQYRLVRLKKICNSRHLTDFNTPRLVCVIIYLICFEKQAQPTALLNLPVSIYTRHPLRMSIGKADHSREMTSGFEPGKPIALDSFQISECNLCIEPWACNMAKGNVDTRVDAIRTHFRTHFKTDNPGLWPEHFLPLNESVTAQYIRSDLVVVQDDDREDVHEAVVAGSTGGPEDTFERPSPESSNEPSAERPATIQRKRPSLTAISTAEHPTQQGRTSSLVVRDTGSPGRAHVDSDSEFLSPDSGSRKSSRGGFDSDVSSARGAGHIRAEQAVLEALEEKVQLAKVQHETLTAKCNTLMENYNEALQRIKELEMQVASKKKVIVID